MPDDKPRRAPSHSDARDRRRTPSSGVKIVAETPAPPQLPRTPTPQDVLSRRVASIELELKDNTRSTIRMEALLESFLGPLVKEQSAKLDTCLHHISASSHIGANVQAMGAKLDGFGVELAAIKTEQQLAAERFEAHDARDLEIHALARETAGRIGAVEQQLAIADNTARVRKQAGKSAAVRLWLPVTKGIGAVLIAVAAAIGVIYAAGGGCS